MIAIIDNGRDYDSHDIWFVKVDNLKQAKAYIKLLKTSSSEDYNDAHAPDAYLVAVSEDFKWFNRGAPRNLEEELDGSQWELICKLMGNELAIKVLRRAAQQQKQYANNWLKTSGKNNKDYNQKMADRFESYAKKYEDAAVSLEKTVK